MIIDLIEAEGGLEGLGVEITSDSPVEEKLDVLHHMNEKDVKKWRERLKIKDDIERLEWKYENACLSAYEMRILAMCNFFNNL
jgi:hypothetical protein